ncbi:MAG TPA: pyrimidine-nucleoside phosphorylase [Tissierellales bacterium]|nr:pyrimidine-nucleoside phosphorylase [Tissierellales bacterium]
MNMYDIIKKKRDGLELNEEEIKYFVEGYTHNKIPDYQVSALLMAIYFNKMNEKETLDLTKAMIDSGDTVDLSMIDGIKVDKHSTGGVGDKTTIALAPMVAACDVPFVKMSGRGLGHTGGTLDKLESIKNFKVELAEEEFRTIAKENGLAICSQSGNITPADKKLYALRDVTATVENISLIASSIMSKKLAISPDAILLDVKVGKGAFMKDIESALLLAEEMVSIGDGFGKETIAVLTNMDEPIGFAVGNALEVKEAVNTLKGKGPSDFHKLCIELGARLLILAQKTSTLDEGKKMLEEVISNGKAYEKFLEMVKIQQGDIRSIENMDLLPEAQHIIEVKSSKDGFVKSIDAEKIGQLALLLGAGREVKDSDIDLAVGIELKKRVDDKVRKGDVLAIVHSNNMDKAKAVEKELKKIIEIGEKNKIAKKLIYGEVTRKGKRLY